MTDQEIKKIESLRNQINSIKASLERNKDNNSDYHIKHKLHLNEMLEKKESELQDVFNANPVKL